MLTKLRWRITLPFMLLILLAMGGLMAYLSRPVCLEDASCVQTAVFTTFILLATAVFLLSLAISATLTRQISQFTTPTRRLLDGDRRPPLPRQGRGELGDFGRVFSQFVDHDNALIAHLQEERDQLSQALVYMADGVIIADHTGRVHQINPAACRLLGVEADKAANHTLAELLRHHDLIDLWQRCQQEEAEQFAAVEISQNLFLQAVITPYQQENFQAYLVVLQDLTTIRRLETVRRDFISNISHELRTPLASLRAVVETLQAGALEDPPAARRFLSRAEHEVDTLTQMVEELLELSRIESGRVPFHLSETAVADFVELPVERFMAQAERDHIPLILDLPGDLPPVLADAGRMQQVVNNLVHNALKFTDEGQVTITAYTGKTAPAPVRKQVAELPPSVIIAVKDSGCGIAADELPRIFERFYKSDRARTRSRGGTGLGLAIARHIVQAHNGRIWAKSKAGKGSTFYFSVPVA
jgi:two-component system phosphate regulon sensor histidine kinase PhoR